MNKVHIELLVVFILFSQALEARKLSKKNMACLYEEDRFSETEWVAFHESPEQTRIFGNLHLRDFTYQHAWDNGGTPIAHILIQYSLLDSYESREVIDSSSIMYKDSLYFGREVNMLVDFIVQAKYPGDYVLQIRITDLNLPDNSRVDFIPLFKTNPWSAQNFLLLDETGQPLFNSALNKEDEFILQYNDPALTHVNIRYYHREFPLAKTPYSIDRRETYTFSPDSLYRQDLVNGRTRLMRFSHEGIYFVQPNPDEPHGFTIFRFDEGFPNVNSAEKAIGHLRYLTTDYEFEKLQAHRNYKIAVDSFWLDHASNDPERARRMIKKYYSRVQDANRFFTSYQEGWKTDRGLIYIIYGPPTEVYRKSDQEEWIYGERGNPLSIRFFFDKVENPFTENDFSLQRSPSYKTSWYVAIENWNR